MRTHLSYAHAAVVVALTLSLAPTYANAQYNAVAGGTLLAQRQW